MSSGKRAGFSIMEVLLATSILLGCIIVLAELASIGRRHAHSAEDLVNAQLLCEAKLNEILCGADSPEPVSDEEFEDNEKWSYSVDVIPTEIPGVSSLVVEVYPSDNADSAASGTDSGQADSSKTCRLVRWIPDANSDSDNSSSNSLIPESNSLFGEGQ